MLSISHYLFFLIINWPGTYALQPRTTTPLDPTPLVHHNLGPPPSSNSTSQGFLDLGGNAVDNSNRGLMDVGGVFGPNGTHSGFKILRLPTKYLYLIAACLLFLIVCLVAVPYPRGVNPEKRPSSMPRTECGPLCWWTEQECAAASLSPFTETDKTSSLPVLPRAVPPWTLARVKKLFDEYNVRLQAAEFDELLSMIQSGEVQLRKTESLPGLLIERRSIVLRICNPSENVHLLVDSAFPSFLWPRGRDGIDVCRDYCFTTLKIPKGTLRYQFRDVIHSGPTSSVGIIPIQHHHHVVDAVLSGVDEDLTWTLPWNGTYRWVSEEDLPDPEKPLMLLLKEPFGKRYLAFEHEPVWIHRGFVESKEDAVRHFFSRVLRLEPDVVKITIPDDTDDVVEALLLAADSSPMWATLGLPAQGSFHTSRPGTWHWTVNKPKDEGGPKRCTRFLESMPLPEWSSHDVARFLRMGRSTGDTLAHSLEAISGCLNAKTCYLLGDQRLNVCVFPVAIILLEADRPCLSRAFLVETVGAPRLPQAPMTSEGVQAATEAAQRALANYAFMRPENLRFERTVVKEVEGEFDLTLVHQYVFRARIPYASLKTTASQEEAATAGRRKKTMKKDIVRRPMSNIHRSCVGQPTNTVTTNTIYSPLCSEQSEDDLRTTVY